MTKTSLGQGQRAEHRIVRYLQWRGWRIVARNWTCRGAELDIVCSRWRTLLIAEVRQRSNHLAARVSVDDAKLNRLKHGTLALVHQHKLWSYDLRWDLFTLNAQMHIKRHTNILDPVIRAAYETKQTAGKPVIPSE